MNPQETTPTNEPEQANQSMTPETQATPQPVTSDQIAPTATESQPALSEAPIMQPVMSVAPEPAVIASGDYLSNPFTNAMKGMVDILKTNPVPALLLPVVGVAIYIGFWVITIVAGSMSIALGLILGLFLVVVMLALIGAFYSIAGSSARDEQVGTGEALSNGFKKVLPFSGLTIICSLLATIGLLLLIIPGLIFIARSSLAPLILFEEKLGPIAALKRSFALTKGHVFEMLGSCVAAMLLGGNYSLLTGAAGVAPFVGRYHDLVALKATSAPKPKTHWLNYTAVILTVLFTVGVVVALIATTAATINDRAHTNAATSDATDFQFDSTDSSSAFPVE